MAKNCFCGCERAVPRFPLGMRAINTRGRQVVGRIEDVERRGGRNVPELAEWFEEGDAIVALLREITHCVRDPRSVNERAIREWQADGRAIAPTARQSQALLGRAVRESGMSSDQAAVAIARGLSEGMSMEEVIDALSRGTLR
jgi:hypothetical protein